MLNLRARGPGLLLPHKSSAMKKLDKRMLPWLLLLLFGGVLLFTQQKRETPWPYFGEVAASSDMQAPAIRP